MRLLILVALFLLPLPALAEFVDAYGNPTFPAESYRQLPGGAAYRDTTGGIHYEYVKPADSMPQSTPSMPPSVQAPSQHDGYEALRDVTPGSSYQSDSIFHDRVRPQPYLGR